MRPAPVLPRPTAAAVAMLLMSVPLAFTVVGGAQQAGGQGCGPAPSGRVAVIVTIDRGVGSPGSRCVVVSHGATGMDALRAAGHAVRLDGGFVCAIDDLPVTGCGNKPDAGNAYWRYWHAPSSGGAWSYSQVGAGGYRLPQRCAVEGWVWSDSPSSDTPPRIAAPSVTCESPASTAPPVTTPPSTAPSGTAPPGSTGSGAAPGAGASTGVSPPASGGGGGASGSGASGSADDPDAATPPADVAAETTVPGGVTDPSESTAPSGSADSVDRASDEAEDASGRDSSESARAAQGSSRRSGAPWGVVVAVVLMAVLGGVAFRRAQLRREGA